MEFKRLLELSKKPPHLRLEGTNEIRFYLDELDETLIFYPSIKNGVIEEMFFNFPENYPLGGMIEGMCSVLKGRPWYHLFNLNLREIKSYVSDHNDPSLEALENEFLQLKDMANGLGSLLGKTLLEGPRSSYKDNFIEDLAVLEESWTHNIEKLFPGPEISILLETFRPPVVGIKVKSHSGFESEVLQFLKENLAFICGQTKWKLVAL